MDENGTVISDVADSFLDSNGITVSWNEGSGANSSNRKKGKKGQDNLMELELLPPIQARLLLLVFLIFNLILSCINVRLIKSFLSHTRSSTL